MSVGDVTSTARGSGARYNDGKPDLSLIPLKLLVINYKEDSGNEVVEALRWLGNFQQTGNVADLDEAIGWLDESWADCARVFEYGKRKYAAWNWAKGMAWSIPIACAARHALAELNGETNDPESGLPHRGHLMCNLVMLRTFVETYPEGNDLPPPELFVPSFPPTPADDHLGPHPEEEVMNNLLDVAHGDFTITAYVPSLRD